MYVGITHSGGFGNGREHRHIPSISSAFWDRIIRLKTGTIVQEVTADPHVIPGKHKRFKYDTHDIVVHTKTVG